MTEVVGKLPGMLVTFLNHIPEGHGDGPQKDFYTRIFNPTPFHVQARIKCRFFSGGEWHDFPEDHYYGGNVDWTIQAGESFTGNLGLPKLLKERIPPEDRELMIDVMPGPGFWIEAEVLVMGEDKPSSLHKVYWQHNGEQWMREPASPIDRGILHG